MPTSINAIASNICHCVLLPWIAENYPWVFDDKRCKNTPPHLGLVRNYANGSCPESLVRQFYDVFPQGLLQQHRLLRNGFPLYLCFQGWEECHVDLAIWMAKKCPESVPHKDNMGLNVLHAVCLALGSSPDPETDAPSECTENMLQILRFFVTEYPQLASVLGKGGRGLPIHYLARRCNRPLVQDAVILLLEAYPECIKKKSGFYLPQLSKDPFLQEIGPLVERKSGVQKEQDWLLPASANFVAYTRSCGNAEVGELFQMWAQQRTCLFFDQVQNQIGEICLSFQEDDAHESSADDSDEEESDSDNIVQYDEPDSEESDDDYIEDSDEEYESE